jgi:hypothetical protein
MPESPRLFTVDEANRTLPLVRPIVEDLLAEHAAWRLEIERYELVIATDPGEEGVEPEAATLARAAAEARAVRIDACLKELAEIGCLFKGFDGGLVDFLSLRDDRPVYLCWRRGESSVTHWHEVDGGFDGRRPIDDHLLSETT